MLLSVVTAGVANAADFAWNDPANGGAWDTVAFWTNNSAYPNSFIDTAVFPQPTNDTPNVAYAVTVTSTGSKSVKALIFRGPSRTSLPRTAYTISGDPITIADGGMIIHEQFSTWNPVNQTINNAIVFSGDASITNLWNGQNGSTFALNGQLSGSGTITLVDGLGNQGGTLAVNGNNTNLTGRIILRSRTVNATYSPWFSMGHANAFGTNATPVILDEARVSLGSITTMKSFVVANNSLLSGAWNATPAVSGSIVISNGLTLILGPPQSPRTGQFNGAISGDGNLAVGSGDNGTISLGGATTNTFTGVTDVSYGTLSLAKSNSATAIPGNIIIRGASTLALANDNQIADTSVISITNSALTASFRLNGCNEVIGGLSAGGTNTFVENNHATAASTLTISNTTDCAYSGIMRNGNTAALNIVKTGSGAFYMNGLATNTGTFAVSGGTLGGTGLICSAVTVAGGAAINPGSAAGAGGAMTITNDLNFANNAILVANLSSPLNRNSSATNSMISGVKNLALPGTINVSALPGFADARPGDYWTLISYSGTLSGLRPVLGSFPQIGRQFLVNIDTPGEVRLVMQRTATIIMIR